MPDETIKDGFVLFWRGIFSQWHPTSFVVEGVHYPTAEHWMMASKARLFGDDPALKAILASDSPKEAKGIGREVNNFDKQFWETKCFDIVVKGNRCKFYQNADAKKRLLDTGNKILVEASPDDKIWGIGIGQGDIRATNPALWNGQNLLGQALMVVRHRLLGVGVTE